MNYEEPDWDAMISYEDAVALGKIQEEEEDLEQPIREEAQ